MHKKGLKDPVVVSAGGICMFLSFLMVVCSFRDFSIMSINYFCSKKKIFLTTKIVFLIVMHFHCRNLESLKTIKKKS